MCYKSTLFAKNISFYVYNLLAILFLFCSPGQRGKYHANAKEMTDIDEVYVKIQTDRMNIIKNSKTCNNAHKTERAIDCPENKLCYSVFDQNNSSLCFVYEG